MIRTPDGRAPDARTLAAVLAAVQAYLDGEARDARGRRPSRLGPWKTAAWGPMRGHDSRPATSWRYAG